jgi:hypothetical protein
MAVRFNDEQMQEIERLALINCNSNTIAEAVGVAVNTLKRHCGRKLRHWRAKYRVNLRESQDKLKETSPDMAKFLGKNELNQVDKQEIRQTGDTIPQLTETERQAIADFNRSLKLRLARG